MKILEAERKNAVRLKGPQPWVFRDAILQPLEQNSSLASNFPRGLLLTARATQTKHRANLFNYHTAQKYLLDKGCFPLEECPFAIFRGTHKDKRDALNGCHHVVLGHPAEHLRRNPQLLTIWEYLRYAVVPSDFGLYPSYSNSPVVPQGPLSTSAGERPLFLPRPPSSQYGFSNAPASMTLASTVMMAKRSKLYELEDLRTKAGSPARNSNPLVANLIHVEVGD